MKTVCRTGQTFSPLPDLPYLPDPTPY